MGGPGPTLWVIINYSLEHAVDHIKDQRTGLINATNKKIIILVGAPTGEGPGPWRRGPP